MTNPIEQLRGLIGLAMTDKHASHEDCDTLREHVATLSALLAKVEAMEKERDAAYAEAGIREGLRMAAEVAKKAGDANNGVDQLDFQVMARLLEKRFLALAGGE